MERHVYAVMVAALLAGYVIKRIKKKQSVAPFPRCGHCGHDVREFLSAPAASFAICPSCGREFGGVGIVPPGEALFRVERRAALVKNAILPVFALIMLGLLAVLRVQSHGYDHGFYLRAGLGALMAPLGVMNLRRLRRGF